MSWSIWERQGDRKGTLATRRRLHALRCCSLTTRSSHHPPPHPAAATTAAAPWTRAAACLATSTPTRAPAPTSARCQTAVSLPLFACLTDEGRRGSAARVAAALDAGCSFLFSLTSSSPLDPHHLAHIHHSRQHVHQTDPEYAGSCGRCYEGGGRRRCFFLAPKRLPCMRMHMHALHALHAHRMLPRRSSLSLAPSKASPRRLTTSPQTQHDLHAITSTPPLRNNSRVRRRRRQGRLRQHALALERVLRHGQERRDHGHRLVPVLVSAAGRSLFVVGCGADGWEDGRLRC